MIKFQAYREDDFFKFCEERESIRIRKENNEPRPYTDDDILHTKKFCNIDRKNDKGTVNLYRAFDNIEDDTLKVAMVLTYRICCSGSLIIKEAELSKDLKNL